MAIIFAVTGVLVAAMLYGLVMMRRKDYGRRRALGATRALVMGLMLLQVGVLAIAGAAVGAGAAFVALALSGDPQPPAGYYAAIAVLAAALATGASIIPALAAATRDPVRELRVP